MPTQPKKRSVLILDDDILLMKALQRVLEKNGFTVTVTTSVQAALMHMTEQSFDAALIDLELGDDLITGFTFFEQAAAHYPSCAFIMFSASRHVESVLKAWRMKFDDYLIKGDTSNNVILDTLNKAIANRRLTSQSKQRNQPIILGELSINQLSREVIWCRQNIDLTPTEFRILLELARFPKTPIPFSRLVTFCRDYTPASEQEAAYLLKPHISNLRRKLEQVGSQRIIESKHGIGVQLNIPDSVTCTSHPPESSSGSPENTEERELFPEFS
jgi:DNA-binding response OmpR family regulator